MHLNTAKKYGFALLCLGWRRKLLPGLVAVFFCRFLDVAIHATSVAARTHGLSSWTILHKKQSTTLYGEIVNSNKVLDSCFFILQKRIKPTRKGFNYESL